MKYTNTTYDIHAASGIFATTPGTGTKPKEITKNRTSQEPPYKVILHNDDFTPMEQVIDVLKKVIPGMDFKKATNIMLEAHKNGKAVATKCHRELAELYQEGLMSGGLISTIEPD